MGRSWEFAIGPDVYGRAWYLAMRSYYGQRCGTAVDLGSEFPGFKHEACHLEGAWHASSGKSGARASKAGWHDAGDYGRYVVNSDLTWIPGTRHLRRGPGGGITVQQPAGTAPAWRAIFDDRDRMVVAVNFNTDVGDAWEYADSPDYPEAMTTLAYRYGLNYLMYSMTH